MVRVEAREKRIAKDWGRVWMFHHDKAWRCMERKKKRKITKRPTEARSKKEKSRSLAALG
jgi:hypothetical protein